MKDAKEYVPEMFKTRRAIQVQNKIKSECQKAAWKCARVSHGQEVNKREWRGEYCLREQRYMYHYLAYRSVDYDHHPIDSRNKRDIRRDREP